MQISVDLEYIKKAIDESQHCQRNWDLSKQISNADLELIIDSIILCPSKQNLAYYDAYVITNRTVIEEIYKNTDGFVLNPTTGETTTNSQTLANVLIAFTKREFGKNTAEDDTHRNIQMDELLSNKQVSENTIRDLTKDAHIALGIAAGYCNLTSNILGYRTGFCTCFNPFVIQKIINSDQEVMLLLGIGFEDQTKNRRIHHYNDNIMFPAKRKVDITITKID
jgi:nitroreductase